MPTASADSSSSSTASTFAPGSPAGSAAQRSGEPSSPDVERTIARNVNADASTFFGIDRGFVFQKCRAFLLCQTHNSIKSIVLSNGPGIARLLAPVMYGCKAQSPGSHRTAGVRQEQPPSERPSSKGLTSRASLNQRRWNNHRAPYSGG